MTVGNMENQNLISSLEAQGVAPSDILEKAGVHAEINSKGMLELKKDI